MWMIQFIQQPLQRWRGTGFKVQRVNTDRTINIGIPLCQAFNSARIISTYANTQKMTNTPRTRRIQRGIERTCVGAQIKAIEVAVRVNQHS
jgi:hypothetical protein